MQNPNQFKQTVEKGMIDLSNTENTISCIVKSDESTALVPGQAVKLVDNYSGVPTVTAITADTDVVFGIVSYNLKDGSFAAGDRLEIAPLNDVVIYMEASAAIARGAKVMPVVTGQKVATATAAKAIIGYALDKASGNASIIRVMLKHYEPIPTP